MGLLDKIGDLAKKAQEKLQEAGTKAQDAVKEFAAKQGAGKPSVALEPPKAASAEQSEWYYTKNGTEISGPGSFSQLKDLAHGGRLLPSDMVWKKEMSKWEPAADIPDLFPQAAPPHAQSLQAQTPPVISQVTPIPSQVPRASTGNVEVGEKTVVPTQAQVFAEIRTTYLGGHPDYPEVAPGNLRLIEDGFEFAPEEEAKPKIKIVYAGILDILEPQRGDFPKEMYQASATKKSAAKWLGLASGLTGAVIPHGRFVTGVGKSVAGSVAGSAALGPPPKNRLTVVMLREGVKHRVLFDVSGATREELEEQAQTFWNQTAKVRGRFGKRAAPSRQGAAPSGDAGSSQVNALKQIKDLLDLGVLSQEEFDEKKAALLARTGPSQSLPQGSAPSSAGLTHLNCWDSL